MSKYRVIDADGHVQEPESLWPQYLEPKYHAIAPRYVTDSQGRSRRHLGGRIQPPIPSSGAAVEHRPGGYDSQARLVDMDEEGMDVSVLYPSTGLHFAAIERLDVCAAFCKAYNNWIYDFTRADPKRLIGIAVVPQTDVHEAMAEITRCVTSLDSKGIFWRPNPIGGRTLDDPYFDPIWSLLEELDVPLTLHEGTTQNVPQAGLDRYDNFLFRHVVSHPHEQQMACLELICGGVLERHPKLRVAFLESGAGWIAYWIERLDHHMKYWGHASAPLPATPSEYYARQCYISADPDERVLPGIIDAIGDDTIIFASDYPHPDGIYPGVVAELADRDDLSEVSKAKILGSNAVRLYSLS